MGVDGQCHAPAALPPGKTLYPLRRKLDGPKGWSGRVKKISPPLGFDPRSVQPVVSRFNDLAIPTQRIPTSLNLNNDEKTNRSLGTEA
jgi:hypothetical protein